MARGCQTDSTKVPPRKSHITKTESGIERRFLLRKHHPPRLRSDGKRRARNSRGSAGIWVIGIPCDSSLSSDVEIVARGVEKGKQSARSQAERRAGYRHQLSRDRSDGEAPDGGARSWSRRVNEITGGSDCDRGGTAGAHVGGKGRTVHRAQLSAIRVNVEPGNVADGGRIWGQVVCRRVRHIEELITPIHS